MSESTAAYYEMREYTPPPPFTVIRFPKGLAFGEGSISAANIDFASQMLMETTIDSDSPEILVAVEADDDGCSDGRLAIVIRTKEQTFKRSLHRAKVFGGAVTMTTAARIGLGLSDGMALEAVFSESINDLVEHGVNFGAHTAEHAHGPDCGCGAIDRAPEALQAVIKKEDEIRGALALLGQDSPNIETVFDNFRSYYRETMSKAEPYEGRTVMKNIIESNAVIKDLGGEHLEGRIVLNKVRGYTVNQNLIRLVTGDRAQVFAIDVWRLEDICKKLYPDQPDEQQKAFLSQLVYTLATSAVLTKGDLPIDIIEQAVPG